MRRIISNSFSGSSYGWGCCRDGFGESCFIHPSSKTSFGLLHHTPFESFFASKMSTLSGWRQAPCPVERRGVQSRRVNYQVTFLCQAGVEYFMNSALPCFRLSKNMGLVSSISRGVQKLEQGGVRAAFMGAVQVGPNCPKNHHSPKSWKMSYWRQPGC